MSSCFALETATTEWGKKPKHFWTNNVPTHLAKVPLIPHRGGRTVFNTNISIGEVSKHWLVPSKSTFLSHLSFLQGLRHNSDLFVFIWPFQALEVLKISAILCPWTLTCQMHMPVGQGLTFHHLSLDLNRSCWLKLRPLRLRMVGPKAWMTSRHRRAELLKRVFGCAQISKFRHASLGKITIDIKTRSIVGAHMLIIFFQA